MSEYSQEILDDLTDEERDALNEDGGGDGGPAASSDDGGAGDDNGSDDGKGQQTDKSVQDGKASGADDGNGADAHGKGKGTGADDGSSADDGKQPAAASDDGASSTKDAVVPLLVAEAPADADAKLKEISDNKASLLDQFDNGDITAKEYQSKLDALNKDERTIERQVEKAQLAAEMKQQQEMGSWLKQVGDFTSKDYPEYSKSRSRWMALDTFVKEIAAKPENANLDGREILRQAHDRVVEDLGEAPKAADTKGQDGKKKEGQPLKGAKIDPPKTLGKVPAADNQEITDGKFAALDRMADTDPLQYEERLYKMSATERDEYLASRG